MTFIGNKRSDFVSEKPLRDFIFVILIAICFFIIVFIFDFRKNKSLERSIQTKAIVKDKSSGWLVNASVFVCYKVNQKTIVSSGIQNVDCFSQLEIGDTVIIEYSIKNPKIARIIDCKK